jgi:uncharacterized protein YyaL (SSP411 family)
MTQQSTNTPPDIALKPANQWQAATLRLWHYLIAHTMQQGVLVGPDPVGRLNHRIWRFAKYYLPVLRGRESYMFLQTQGYWIMLNWLLYAASGQRVYRATAIDCASTISRTQREDGGWDYPRISYERMGQTATVEGVWGALGLLATYAHTGDEHYLAAARRWAEFVEQRMGYEVFFHPELGACWAVNYYWPVPRGKVPNNATMQLYFNAWAYKLTGDDFYTQHFDGILNFIKVAQLPSGALFYQYPDRPHYLCYQYNAYEFMDLTATYRLTGDAGMLPLLRAMARFLEQGQCPDGACRNNIKRDLPEVDYYTAALGNAFLEAYQIGLGEHYLERSQRAYQHLLLRQRPDGTWAYSERNYGGLLQDGRVYPRYMAMTLFHLARHTWPDVEYLPIRA